jgi:hypothetical protein
VVLSLRLPLADENVSMDPLRRVVIPAQSSISVSRKTWIPARWYDGFGDSALSLFDQAHVISKERLMTYARLQ